MTADPTQREVRALVAGHGGQGVLTLGKLLCTGAMREGRNVTYLPSYGAEVRGGTANCQVVLSPEPIYSPLVEEADALVVLNQPSWDRFCGAVRPGGIVVADTSGVDADAEALADGVGLCSVPATETAAGLGSVQVANVLLLGALIARLPVVAPETCLDAVRELLGERKAHLLSVNEKAFERGRQLAAS